MNKIIKKYSGILAVILPVFLISGCGRIFSKQNMPAAQKLPYPIAVKRTVNEEHICRFKSQAGAKYGSYYTADKDTKIYYEPCSEIKKLNIPEKSGWHYAGKMHSPRIYPIVKRIGSKIVFAYGSGRKYASRGYAGAAYPQDSRGLAQIEVFNLNTNELTGYYYKDFIDINPDFGSDDYMSKIISKADDDVMYIKVLKLSRNKSYSAVVIDADNGYAALHIFPSKREEGSAIPVNEEGWFEQAVYPFISNINFNDRFYTRNKEPYKAVFDNWLNEYKMMDIPNACSYAESLCYMDKIFAEKTAYDANVKIVPVKDYYEREIIILDGKMYYSSIYENNWNTLWIRTFPQPLPDFCRGNFLLDVNELAGFDKKQNKLYLYGFEKDTDKYVCKKQHIFNIDKDYAIKAKLDKSEYLFENKDNYIIYNKITADKIIIPKNEKLPQKPVIIKRGNSIILFGGIKPNTRDEVSDDIWVYNFKQ